MNEKQQKILDICYEHNGYRNGDKEIRFNPNFENYKKRGLSPSWEYWYRGQLKDFCPGPETPDYLIIKYFKEAQG